MSTVVEGQIKEAWLGFLRTAEAKAIISNANGASKEVMDKLLLAALAFTRDGAGGSPMTGFHRWSDLRFPPPPPTAYIPQSGAVSGPLDLGIMTVPPPLRVRNARPLTISGLSIQSIQSAIPYVLS